MNPVLLASVSASAEATPEKATISAPSTLRAAAHFLYPSRD